MGIHTEEKEIIQPFKQALGCPGSLLHGRTLILDLALGRSEESFSGRSV